MHKEDKIGQEGEFSNIELNNFFATMIRLFENKGVSGIDISVFLKIVIELSRYPNGIEMAYTKYIATDIKAPQNRTLAGKN